MNYVLNDIISRHAARNITFDILKQAEQDYIDIAEKEALQGINWEDDMLSNTVAAINNSS